MIEPKSLGQLDEKYPMVAATFKTHWNSTLKKYASQLYKSPPRRLEDELKNAFTAEWQLHGVGSAQSQNLLQRLEEVPVLQTSHHVTPTNGPTFLAIDIISQLGLAEKDTYLVAANSGVAFSNTAWSGALSFGNLPIEKLINKDQPLFNKENKSSRDRKRDGIYHQRISLIPASRRDQILYGSKVDQGLVDVYSQFTPETKEKLLKPKENQSYSTWACQVCSKIQEKVISKCKVFVFDINRIIKTYLIHVLNRQEDHLIKEILFSDSLSKKINQTFDNPSFFLGSYRSKKSMKIENLGWEERGTMGSKSGKTKFNAESLTRALEEEKLCPGVFLQFLVLRFINGIKCLGSFHQAEYLEGYRNKWLELGSQWSLALEPDTGPALTTGRMQKGGEEIFPLDLMMNNDKIDLNSIGNQSISEFWAPVITQLIR